MLGKPFRNPADKFLIFFSFTISQKRKRRKNYNVFMMIKKSLVIEIYLFIVQKKYV